MPEGQGESCLLQACLAFLAAKRQEGQVSTAECPSSPVLLPARGDLANCMRVSTLSRTDSLGCRDLVG